MNIDVSDTYNRYKTLIVTSIITATIVLVSLAWSDVIQTIMNVYYPNNDKSITGKIYYAVIVTLIVLMLQIYIFPYINKTAGIKND